MRAPRSVTLQPIGMPSRSLKPAIDFFAFVISGRWPAMIASCSTASSSDFEFCLASPTPMFSVILLSARHLHGRAVREALLERLAHLALVTAAQARRGDCGLCHCDQVTSRCLAPQPGRRQWRILSPLSAKR